MLKARLAVPTQSWGLSSAAHGGRPVPRFGAGAQTGPRKLLPSLLACRPCLNPNELSRQPEARTQPSSRLNQRRPFLQRGGEKPELLQGRRAGGTAEGGPGPIQPRPHGHLAEHLVPVEDGLALLLHLQLPALLGALHTLQDRVGAGSPEGSHGRSHGASILQWEGRSEMWLCRLWGLESPPCDPEV